MDSPAPLVNHGAVSGPTSLRSQTPRRLDRAMQRAALATRHRYALAVLACTLVAAFIGLLVELPILIWVAATGSVTFFGFVGIHAVSPVRGNALYGAVGPPLDVEIEPSEIHSPELRAAYANVLHAHRRIRTALADREGAIDVLLEPYRRCGELVLLAGRVARVGNALQSYVEEHDPEQLAAEIELLQIKADHSEDLETRRAYRRTAEARSRQLGSYLEFRRLLDRILARLRLIAASLESLLALVVKVHARLLEQTAFSGESMSNWLDVLQDDLEILEDALDKALFGEIETPAFPPALPVEIAPTA